MFLTLVLNGSKSVFFVKVNPISRYLKIAISEVGTSTAHFLNTTERYVNQMYTIDDFIMCGNSKTCFVFVTIIVPCRRCMKSTTFIRVLIVQTHIWPFQLYKYNSINHVFCPM